MRRGIRGGLAALGMAAALGAAAPAGAQSAEQLAPDMRRALIVGIQEELQDHGYPAGSADGVYGPKTRSAITQYQRDAGLTPNGQASKELLDHLKFAKPAIYKNRPGRAASGLSEPPERRASVTGDLAVAVQRELKVRGYYNGALDGIAGRNTQAAVRAFQRDAGLPVTGVVDERLLAELRAIDPKITAGRGT